MNAFLKYVWRKIEIGANVKEARSRLELSLLLIIPDYDYLWFLSKERKN